MSQYLNYLERYEEKGNDVTIYLKEFPSSKIAGNKIARELFISLFHDESLQLNRVHKIDELTYLIQKKQEFYCLNCNTPIYFEEEYYVLTCEACNWRNELNEFPTAITPITLKTKENNDEYQICYPLIEERDLDEIPEKLKEAILTYFKEPDKFTKNHKDNIYHNLLEKNAIKYDKLSKKLANKAKLVRFFQQTDYFANKQFDCAEKEACDEYLEGKCPHSVDCPEYKKRGN